MNRGKSAGVSKMLQQQEIWSQTIGRLISLSWENRCELNIGMRMLGEGGNNHLLVQGQLTLMPNPDFYPAFLKCIRDEKK